MKILSRNDWKGLGSQLDLRLPDVLAVVLADAALERRRQAADQLDRQRLALGLIDSQLLVLDPSDPASHAEKCPAV